MFNKNAWNTGSINEKLCILYSKTIFFYSLRLYQPGLRLSLQHLAKYKVALAGKSHDLLPKLQFTRLVIVALNAVLPFGLVAIILLKREQTQLHKPSDCHGEHNGDQKHSVDFGKTRTPRLEFVKLICFSNSGLAPFKTALQLVSADHQRR